MPRKYIKTLPNKEKGTRGDTYLYNYDIARENIKVINGIVKTLVESNKLLGQQILSYQSQLRIPELKNNPITDLIVPILDSLRIQISVSNEKLATIATSSLTIQQALEDNYQIVDDNLNLPTGLESELSEKLQELIDQQRRMAESLNHLID